jgi:hypothetical protein
MAKADKIGKKHDSQKDSYMKILHSSLAILIVVTAAACGGAQTVQGQTNSGINGNAATPSSGAVSPRINRPVVATPKPPPSDSVFPNNRAVVPPTRAIPPAGNRSVAPNSMVPQPNPYTNNGMNGNYGNLGPNGFYKPGTNGFYTPGTNGFYKPGANGFIGTPTNGFYRGPSGGNFLNTAPNGNGSSGGR